MGRFDEGQKVDVAQDGLPVAPKFEHDRATVHAVGVDVARAVARRFTVGGTSHRPSSVERVLGRRPVASGNVVEVLSYRGVTEHQDTTYYHVVFDSGGQGVYPEESLVPTPEDALTEDESTEAKEGDDD